VGFHDQWRDAGSRDLVRPQGALTGFWRAQGSVAVGRSYSSLAMPCITFAAAQVLSSQAVDLVLMLAVAAAMVAHTLRYRSQW